MSKSRNQQNGYRHREVNQEDRRQGGLTVAVLFSKDHKTIGAELSLLACLVYSGMACSMLC